MSADGAPLDERAVGSARRWTADRCVAHRADASLLVVLAARLPDALRLDGQRRRSRRSAQSIASPPVLIPSPIAFDAVPDGSCAG